MSSEVATKAFVWMWLPGATEPKLAGRLDQSGSRLLFTYDADYGHRKDAIPIYGPELPIRGGAIEPIRGLSMASCIRDSSPDAWGRRVVINRLQGKRLEADREPEITELTFLLKSGSDRIGALDIQASPTEYVPRLAVPTSLDELLEAATVVDNGFPLKPALDRVISYSTSVGGARPKALIANGTKKFIAKFSTSNDTYSVVKAEFIAMTLARAIGLNVAKVAMSSAAHKDVLLVERFDRRHTNEGWTRRAMVSALTMFGLDEMMGRYASYEDLAEIVRHRFTAPKDTLKELYGRMCFNILCGNTDDHARNHSAFWDGQMLTLTPAYDICPQGRTGNEASQAMLIKGDDRASTLSSLLAAAPDYRLKETEAAALIESQIVTIAEHWQEVCAQAELSSIDCKQFSTRQFLNDYAIYGLDTHKALRDAFVSAKSALSASGTT